MKQIIKSHTDVITVPEEIEKMRRDYEEQGYQCELLADLLKLVFDDGYVMIFFQNGAFYQECHLY